MLTQKRRKIKPDNFFTSHVWRARSRGGCCVVQPRPTELEEAVSDGCCGLDGRRLHVGHVLVLGEGGRGLRVHFPPVAEVGLVAQQQLRGVFPPAGVGGELVDLSQPLGQVDEGLAVG